MSGGAAQSYRYLRPSALVADRDGADLCLETSGGRTASGQAANPRFFAGFLTEPAQAATGLLAVADGGAGPLLRPVTAQRLQEILDPVVTGNGDRLRFESFSGCCGVYARLDVLGDGLDGDVIDRGTTNVDVNMPLREALARVGGGDPLHLSVGPDDLTVTTLDGAVVEKKVPLPTRWLRGFAEVQVTRRRLRPARRAAPPRGRAVPALRCPAGSDRGALWAVPAGRTLRLTARPAPGAVCICRGRSGWDLAPLLRFAKRAARLRPASGRARRRCRAPGSWSCPARGSR